MREQSIAYKKHLIVSVVLICLFLIASISFPVVGRWGSFRASGIELTMLVIWIVWIIHAGWSLSRLTLAHSGRVYLSAKIFGAVFASAIAIWVACLLGGAIGQALRLHEVRAAVDAGLQEDCLNLLHNWPVKDDRIEDYSSEYVKLPASIKMLAPAYVSNDHLDDTSIPPNIGLCKNGWGGFALGIRVFQSDEDAKKLKVGEGIRVAPGIYIWWQDT